MHNRALIKDEDEVGQSYSPDCSAVYLHMQ